MRIEPKERRVCDQCGAELLHKEAGKQFLRVSLDYNRISNKLWGDTSFPQNTDFCDFTCLRDWCENHMKYNHEFNKDFVKKR